jgi:hypothetical protein
MKLSRLLEDKDLVLGGSKEFSATEKLVLQKHDKPGVGSGIKPPPKGDISQFVEGASPAFATDSLVPSRIHRKGQDPKVNKLKA